MSTETTTETKLLQVGDVIYSSGNYGVQHRFVIDRVTNTQAFSSNTKFKREIFSSGSVRIIGNTNSWSTTNYKIETEKLKGDYFRKQMESKISAANVKALSDEQVLSIYNIIEFGK